VNHRHHSSAVALAVVLLLSGSAAFGQAAIKVSETVNFKFGILLQPQADSLQDTATRGYTNNLFVRRMRLLLAGQIAPNVTFFFETDNPNLGKAPKTLGSGFVTQDAYVEWKLNDKMQLAGGLILVPFCRNCLQSAATLLPVDYGTYSFLQSAPTQSSAGRDTGVQMRGALLSKKLEYRVGVFQGVRGAGSRNAFRTAARVQYDFWDSQAGPFFYAGTFLGKKKVLAIGAATDRQDDFASYAVDLFMERPLRNGNSVIFQTDYLHNDGGKMLTALSEQRDLYTELGYYFGKRKLLPYVRVENQGFCEARNTGRDQRRYQGGLAFFPNGHNLNVKGAYTRISPRVGESTNQFTIQMQFFYF
jgi:hypothetical protein